MSQETSLWLNENCLIGFTDQRGHAWHYRASDQGAEPNHYPGAIPVEDVRRRLFHWKPVEGKITATVVNDDGVLTVTDPDRKAIVRPDTGTILGIFKDGYQIHDFDEWLVKNVESLLDDDLSIGSALLLKGGGVAAVTIEVPENIVTPEGVEFRPHLVAATSLDGSLSTTYQRTVGLPICDNTLSAALGEKGQRIKIKHSRYSKLKLGEAKSALAIVHSLADDFAEQVAALTAVKMDAPAFDRLVNVLAPLKDANGDDKTGRGLTVAQNKADALRRLWNTDLRVAPWKGTAWGAIQLVNTYEHHEAVVRGAGRAERNMLRTVQGAWDTLDAQTLATVEAVLS